MNKEFEKILEMLILESSSCEVYKLINPNKENVAEFNTYKKCIEIVKEVAEEYNGGWIACSEMLPEENGMYLCTQNRYDLATNKNIIRVSTELVEFYNGEWRRAKNLVITHWQPLPEPFKERD